MNAQNYAKRKARASHHARAFCVLEGAAFCGMIVELRTVDACDASIWPIAERNLRADMVAI